jgi:hypothetical protein
MRGFDLIEAVRGVRLCLAVHSRRLAYEIAVALFDRIARCSALDDRQRRISSTVTATGSQRFAEAIPRGCRPDIRRSSHRGTTRSR